MPVANDKNEKDIKTPSEGTQGGQSAPKRKLNVVFRKQNSTSIKELPKRLRTAADGSAAKAKSEEGTENAGAQRRPRPLPAGTKPVKPAAAALRSEAQAERMAAEQTVRSEALSKTAEEVSAEIKKADLNAAEAETREKAAENTVQSTAEPKAEEKQAESAIEKPAQETSAASEKKDEAAAVKPAEKAATENKTEDSTIKTEEKAEEKKPDSGEAPKRPSLADPIVPKVKIVKSYANYDAAAVIAEASRQARQERAQQSQGARNGGQGGQGQRRPRPNGAQGQRPAQGDGQRNGGRTFVARGNAAPGQRPAAPGQRNARPGQGAGAPSGRPSQGGGAFDGSAKNQNGRNARSSYGSKDKRNDRKDKYIDDLSAAGKTKTGKGAFIKPEPKAERPEDEIKVIKLPETLTIKELADKLRLQPSVIVKKLFLAGKMVTPNTDLSYEEAEEIAMEYEILCEKEEEIDVIAELLKEDEEDPDKLKTRNPVVCVMGHVDHGKTSLLDAIRQTDVTEHEAGGITQHIGAYQVKINDRLITFLDTPGHEAFTAMRMRGAQATDIAVLVVAADDGVMPQTIEAINHAKAAGVEIIVAINKIDKPSANVDRVKQELSEYELIPEDWGGNTTFCEVSAHTKEGIPNLLEMILLTADVKELKANPNRKARGLVIEAELDKGKGPVATVLVQKGTLHVGDFIAAGACSGKVRAMMNDKGQRVEKALPSTPVEILGLDNVPNAGEICLAMDNDKEAKNFAATFISEGKNKLIEDTKAKLSLDNLFDQMKASDIKELPIIVKADVQGSVEAVKQSLGKLSNEEVQVRVIHSGVGAINESDVSLAAASNAIIIGFDVRPDTTAKATAEREKVDIRLYKVIYQAIEDIEAAMNGMLAPIYEEKVLGHAEVRQLFKASGVGTIAGAYILDGKFERGCKARITRDGEQIFDGALASLKRFKDDVKEVTAGYECGLVFEKFNDLQELDQIEAYGMVEVPRGERNEKKQQ